MTKPHPRQLTQAVLRSGARGFTLIELMTVVLIIALLAIIAVPAASSAVRERRSATAANYIVQQYRAARARALGRGSAVLVRYESGRVRVREAIAGGQAPAGGCNLVPVSSCTDSITRWDTATQYREIDNFDPTGYDGVAFQFSVFAQNSTTPTTTNFADICYTPGGRTFFRNATGIALTELTSVAAIRVRMEYTTDVVAGVQRMIYILPNAGARVAL